MRKLVATVQIEVDLDGGCDASDYRFRFPERIRAEIQAKIGMLDTRVDVSSCEIKNLTQEELRKYGQA